MAPQRRRMERCYQSLGDPPTPEGVGREGIRGWGLGDGGDGGRWWQEVTILARMDPLTQGVLGAVVVQSVARPREQRLAAVVGFIAGTLADLDVLIRSSSDPLLAIDYHRHFTHSLFFVPVAATLLAAILAPWLGWLRDRSGLADLALGRVWCWIALGYGTHGLLDACTTYGTRLLWPLSDERFAWDLVGVIDPGFTFPALGLMILAWRRRSPRLGRAAMAWCLVWLSLGAVQRERANDLMARLAESRGEVITRGGAKPTLLNLLLWRGVWQSGDTLRVAALRPGIWGPDRVSRVRSVPAFRVETALPTLPPDSVHALDLERFRHFSDDWLVPVGTRDGASLVVGDLRYSLLPSEIQPLWGIRLDANNAAGHVPFLTLRKMAPGTLRRFRAMVSGRALTPFPADGPTFAQELGFDVLHSGITVDLDFEEQSLTGSTTHRLVVLDRTLERLEFSPNALTIEAATVDGHPTAFEQNDHHIAVDLAGRGATGVPIEVHFAYRGTPARGVAWEVNGAATAYFACDWMVCRQDVTADKATIGLTLHTPLNYGSRANGIDVGKVQTGDRLEHRWHEARPLPAFGLGFAVGSFDGVWWEQRHRRFDAVSVATSSEEIHRLLEDTAGMMAYFERVAGVPFPFESYGQVIVPGHQAQEAGGFSILGLETLRPMLEDPHEDWAIAHELAHQWWGMLLTCQSWSEMWLNEGIVTFLVAAYKQQRWGEAHYQRELELARTRWDKAKKAGWDVPLAFAGSYPDLRTRRAITYSKAAVFLDLLRRTVGQEAFWSGLRLYTVRHVDDVVVSADFQAAMEEASGQDLSALFEEWVVGREAEAGISEAEMVRD